MRPTPVPFVLFGIAHLSALLVIALLGLGLAALVRRRPRAAPPVRCALAASLVALVAFELASGVREGWLDWRAVLPLELCDAAMLLTLWTLLRPRTGTAAEVVYFWAGSGSLLAMLTPELRWGFPRWEFLVFFGLHGLVWVSTLVLVFGLRLHPRPGAPLRMLAVTLAWAAFVGLVDWVLGSNFMYLCRKPAVPTLLDWMGPWPLYLVSAAALAWVLFELLSLPFRRSWRRAERAE